MKIGCATWAMRSMPSLMFGLILSGCQTLRSISTEARAFPAPLPATVEGLYAVCSPGGGHGHLKIRNQDGSLVALDIDWAADGDGTWEMEGVNPLGQSILTIQSTRGRSLTVGGAVASNLPQLGVDPEMGLLQVEGQTLGLGVDEIPCVLAGRLPRGWREGMEDAEGADPLRLTSWISGERRVQTELRGLDEPPAREICSTVSWWRFWILGRSDLNWCMRHERSGTMRSRLWGVGAVELEWEGERG